jgi:hypothetical protein
MTWIFAVAAAAGMGAAGYWIGRHHQEDEAVIPPTPEIRERLEKEIREALDKAWESRDVIVQMLRLDFPALPDSALAEDQVAGVHGKINAAAEIASRMETPRGPRKTGILPMEDLTGGRVHPFLEWLNSQGCVAGARVPMASAEGRTAYGMLTSNPGKVPVNYNLRVRDAAGEIRLHPGIAYLEIDIPPKLLPAQESPAEVRKLLVEDPE